VVIFAKLLSLIAIIYLVSFFVYPIFKPMSGKRKKRSREFLAVVKKQNKREKYLYFKDIVLRKLSKKLFVNDLKREQLSFILNRLDLKITPEEVRLNQILYALVALLVSTVMMKLMPILGYICLIFVVLGWLYPIDELEKKVERKNKNILKDFPAFYSMVYYQYSRSINIYLADVIKDFLPNANQDMADELGVLLDNIEYGEEYALKQFKKRVPLRYIMKFCDIMETRLKGYDNTSQMAYLKNELYDLRVVALEEELNNRKASNERTQFILIVILVIYILVYYYFQFIGAIKLFG
jgi:Flp pilus assembly protein TadB